MDKEYRLEFAKPEDASSWMELANLVKHNFPGFDAAEYEKLLCRNIERQSALCVKFRDEIAGVLLFSIRAGCLSCMAVHPDHRQKGIGSALVAKMIECFPRGASIEVCTFRKEDPLGAAPRALYKKYGFEEGELLIEHSYPQQKFALRRD